MALDLVPLWAAILAFGVLMYVLLDGFDLASASCSRSRPTTPAATR